MLSSSRTISVRGVSKISVNGVDTPVAYFNTQIQANGKYNINESIENVELYKANKDTVKEDYNEFEELVESMTW